MTSAIKTVTFLSTSNEVSIVLKVSDDQTPVVELENKLLELANQGVHLPVADDFEIYSSY